METRSIAYEVDGLECIGHLAVPDGDGKRPAILVCHEGGGFDEHARNTANRVATELGYVAFALDYFGGGKPIAGDQVMGSIVALMQAPDRIRALANAGLTQLLTEERADATRVGAIGFCFGGTMSLELGRSGADVKAIVGFHSGLSNPSPGDEKHFVGKVVVCVGDADPLIPTEQRAAFEAEMRATTVDWQLHLFGGVGHSFTNPAADGTRMAAIKYHEPSAKRSWKVMVDLFAETF